MTRADNIEDGGFPVYEGKNIRKVNAMRRAWSLPASTSPVVPTKGQALFTTAESMNNEPASCANCIFYNVSPGSCQLIGSRIPIKKFVYPKEATADSKQIEYWPCCGMQQYGEPNRGPAKYRATNDPDYMDLVWINAPKVGQEIGGANCGGTNGGDDCDHYIVEGDTAKWDCPTGFCRALQTDVACGDICSLWGDDDELKWREAVKIINELL